MEDRLETEQKSFGLRQDPPRREHPIRFCGLTPRTYKDSVPYKWADLTSAVSRKKYMPSKPRQTPRSKGSPKSLKTLLSKQTESIKSMFELTRNLS